jgi:hypothetical protein
MIQKKSAKSVLDPFVWWPLRMAADTGSRIANAPQADTELPDARHDFFKNDTYGDFLSTLANSAISEQLRNSQQEVQRLQKQLAVSQFHHHEESEIPAIIIDVIGKIVEISDRLFPGSISLEYDFDPENPSEKWLVFNVIAKGEYADYRDREFEWHEEVEQLVPGTLCEFRLCVMPQR